MREFRELFAKANFWIRREMGQPFNDSVEAVKLVAN